MTRNQIILRQPPSVHRNQPLLSAPSKKGSSARLAEVAGGTTAECAVVCCCCPCGLIDLLILVIYKIPAGLCKRLAKRRRRKKLIKKGLSPSTVSSGRSSCSGYDEAGMYVHPAMVESEKEWVLMGEDKDVGGGCGIEDGLMELEKEMLKRFYCTGFWRSASEKSETDTTMTMTMTTSY